MNTLKKLILNGPLKVCCVWRNQETIINYQIQLYSSFVQRTLTEESPTGPKRLIFKKYCTTTDHP